MEQKNQKWNSVLELIFDNPNKIFTIREISKKTRVPTSTVQRYLKELKEKNIIDKENKFVYNSYSKFLKAFFIIEKLYKSGLIDYIVKELNPSAIMLFGGIRKGEYDQDSDIDLFVEATTTKELKMKEFERKIKKDIHLFIESDINKLQKNLLNNIINGIKFHQES